MSQMDSQSTPPVINDFHLPVEPPAWPKVVGIISIVWGSLSMLCNLCGLITPLVQGAMLNMVPPEQQSQMKAQMAGSGSPLALASAALGMLASVLLLVAGVQTLRRMPIGRPLHMAWAAASLLLVVLGGYVGWQNFQSQMQAMQNDPNSRQAMAGAQTFGVAIFGCIMILVTIYPIFCLVWFGPMGKRPEAGAVPQEPLV